MSSKSALQRVAERSDVTLVIICVASYVFIRIVESISWLKSTSPWMIYLSLIFMLVLFLNRSFAREILALQQKVHELEKQLKSNDPAA